MRSKNVKSSQQQPSIRLCSTEEGVIESQTLTSGVALAPKSAESKLTAGNRLMLSVHCDCSNSFPFLESQQGVITFLCPLIPMYQTRDGCSETQVRVSHRPMKMHGLQNSQRAVGLGQEPVS